jgi:hypothetical protein
VVTQDPEKGGNLRSYQYSEIDAHVRPWCKNVVRVPLHKWVKFRSRLAILKCPTEGCRSYSISQMAFKHAMNDFESVLKSSSDDTWCRLKGFYMESDLDSDQIHETATIF